jgi:tRNA(fMet)-specific endonuclease VapC
MRYLLDSNVISHLVRFPRGSSARRLDDVGQEHVFTSIIVSSEVNYGVRKRGSAELTRKVGDVLGRMFVAVFEPPADQHYAVLRCAMDAAGKALAPNDLLIASHALALDATLVTDDRAFAFVPDLRTENWIQDEQAA